MKLNNKSDTELKLKNQNSEYIRTKNVETKTYPN